MRWIRIHNFFKMQLSIFDNAKNIGERQIFKSELMLFSNDKLDM
jgi:hypothetical protein